MQCQQVLTLAGVARFGHPASTTDRPRRSDDTRSRSATRLESAGGGRSMAISARPTRRSALFTSAGPRRAGRRYDGDTRRRAAAYLAAQTEIRPRTREKYETGYVSTSYPARPSADRHDHDRRRLSDRGSDASQGSGWLDDPRRPRPALASVRVRRPPRLPRCEPGVGTRTIRAPEGRETAEASPLTEETRRLIDAATPLYRPMLALAGYTGLRQSECLGLHWRDVDFDAGFIRVRAQLDRGGERVEPKPARLFATSSSRPTRRMLRAHRLASLTRATATSCSSTRPDGRSTRGTFRLAASTGRRGCRDSTRARSGKRRSRSSTHLRLHVDLRGCRRRTCL